MEIDTSYLLDLHILLEKVNSCGGSMVYVAGGAVRDMLLQKEIADIDVFYEGTLVDAKVMEQWPSAITKPELQYLGCQVTYDVMDVLFPVKVQLIKVDNVPLHISKFPTPLSRVHYSRFAGLVGVNKTFLECEESKTLLFDKEVDIHYLTKLQAKFPEYTTKFTQSEFNPEMMKVTPF